MHSNKHTPGPWIIADDGTIEANHLGRVGFLTHASPADSALIAAAPDMLEALKDARSRLADFIGSDCECDNTHQANNTKCCLCEYADTIAKAEGRS